MGNQNQQPLDPSGPTRPVRPARIPASQPSPPQPPAAPTVRIPRQTVYDQYATPVGEPYRPRRKGCLRGSCGCLSLFILAGLFLVLAYFLFPAPTRILLMGIDAREQEANLGRTDTIILTQIDPLKPDVRMLSIPRDLWVTMPGIGENRINTAHFFAEAAVPGSGPQALMDTVEANFQVKPDYFMRIRFDGLSAIIDAMGGVKITIAEPMGGLPAGQHLLNGEQALAFSRERYSSDDFSRMQQGQIVLKAVAQRLVQPEVWPRYPAVLSTLEQFVDTDVPIWLWPRLGVAVMRGGLSGVDSRTITREMTVPFTTDGGAQVLGPNWDLIRPMVQEMFGN